MLAKCVRQEREVCGGGPAYNFPVPKRSGLLPEYGHYVGACTSRILRVDGQLRARSKELEVQVDRILAVEHLFIGDRRSTPFVRAGGEMNIEAPSAPAIIVIPETLAVARLQRCNSWQLATARRSVASCERPFAIRFSPSSPGPPLPPRTGQCSEELLPLLRFPYPCGRILRLKTTRSFQLPKSSSVATTART